MVGVAGIEHGAFEALQGNERPTGLLIDAIGPAQRFWEHGTETALTVVPSFLMTGVLALVLGTAVTLWSTLMITRRAGANVLLAMCVALFLVGGGFAPIFVSLLGFAAATRIGKPLRWWRRVCRGRFRTILAALFPWSLAAFVLAYAVGVEIAIFGAPATSLFGAETAVVILTDLSYVMLALLMVTVPCAFARDIVATEESTIA